MKPDDYFNNGLFEIVRFGRHTFATNNMSPKQHKKYIRKFAKKYSRIKRKIDKLVKSIRRQVCRCNPLDLLAYSSDLFLISNLGIESEIQVTKDELFASRMTEYIQSIFVATPLKYKPTKKDPSKHFCQIERKMKKIYALIDKFYVSWIAQFERLLPDYDDEIRKVVFESQLLYSVRGHRYQIFEIEYLERLLGVHSDLFKKTFGISSEEIVSGIKNLQYALSQGKLDVLNEFDDFLENIDKMERMDDETFRKNLSTFREKFKENFFGTKLRDVISITGWPEKFIKCLSWEINECKNFYNEKDFSGWPIVDLPIHKRPFIKIEQRYYCFDYYSLMDNFYRALQKAMSREVPSYRWSDFQKDASENMVADIFSQILPGCSVYRDNYYPRTQSLKKLNENDLIIQYADILVIVEVKAGSFVFTAPILDFENHITSYKNLIEKADCQCKNTCDYLSSCDVALLYNQDSSLKAKIDMSEINDIFMVSVTVDNINDFAARAEKLSFLDLKCNAISLCIDDLMVYREYFDSPLVFLHFLKQRRQATLEKKLALNDELDHLGMYIEHNMYCMQLREYPDDAQIMFYGYREALDNYFCSLYHPELKHEKPMLKIPQFFMEIINYLERSDIENKVEISNYLLDFSTEAKNQLCQYIEYSLWRQKKIGKMISCSTSGCDDLSLRYTVFINQPKVESFSEKYKRNYVLSTMLWNEEPSRLLLEFGFDYENNLISMYAKQYHISDVTQEEYSELFEIGKGRAIERLTTYIKQNGKIAKTEFCPCGSGKLFESCCEKLMGSST